MAGAAQSHDERLRDRIMDQLRDDPDIEVGGIAVLVRDSLVKLEGSVPSDHMKYLVEDVADQAGVDDVLNNLRVQGRSERNQ